MASYEVPTESTVTCRFCEQEQPADAEHFFPFRAVEGAIHVRSRCRTCETEYRAGLKADGERTIVRRTRQPQEPRVRQTPFTAAFAASASKVAEPESDEPVEPDESVEPTEPESDESVSSDATDDEPASSDE